MNSLKISVAGIILFLVAACGGGYHSAPVPVQPVAQSSDWVSGCVDDFNTRVTDDFCDSPHAHYYPVWHPIGPSYVMPPYGARLYGGGWSARGVRPTQVTNVNVINHVSSSGGSVSRNGQGTGLTSSSKINGASAGYRPSRIAPRTSTPTGDTKPAASTGSSTVQRGGLGPTGTAKSGATQTKKNGK